MHATDALESLVVVKNNADWHVVRDPGMDVALELENLKRPRGSVDWYYVRVTQKDGHSAWSSPIWIRDAAAPGRQNHDGGMRA